MNCAEVLYGVAAEQFVAGAAQATGVEPEARNLLGAYDLLRKQLEHPEGTFRRALAAANAKAWETLEVLLAGDELLAQLDQPADATLRNALHTLLAEPLAAAHRLLDPAMRLAALAELRQARRAGVLDWPDLDVDCLQHAAGAYGATIVAQGLEEAEWHQVVGLGETVSARGYTTLGQVVAKRPRQGQPLLIRAVRSAFILSLGGGEPLLPGADDLITLTELQIALAARQDRVRELLTGIDAALPPPVVAPALAPPMDVLPAAPSPPRRRVYSGPPLWDEPSRRPTGAVEPQRPDHRPRRHEPATSVRPRSPVRRSRGLGLSPSMIALLVAGVLLVMVGIVSLPRLLLPRRQPATATELFAGSLSLPARSTPAAGAAEAKRTLSEAELEKTLKDLQTGDWSGSYWAANKFAHAQPSDERQAEVAKALVEILDRGKLANGQRLTLTTDYYHALEAWATPEVEPTLLAWLKDEKAKGADHWRQQHAIKILGQIGDEQAIEPLAGCLGSPFIRVQAREALIQLAGAKRDFAVAPASVVLGSPSWAWTAGIAQRTDRALAVERAMWAKFQDANDAARMEACHVLKAIGGPESVAKLQDLEQQDQRRHVKAAATEAIRAVRSRTTTGR
jgi:hypothetical protein